jgi:UDP-N-acetylglucosamine--N-acetylmuramyl-(pentapeptide) pyrophosphoryl-undecaprenol N-acetylglucosamine transferase
MAPPNSIRGCVLLVLATLRSLTTLLRARPRAMCATGGYVSAPAVFASWLLRIPVVVFLPDIVPGKAVRYLAPLTRKLAVSAEESIVGLPARKVVVTGYPVRDCFLTASRHRGRSSLKLPDDAIVLCVFGGSQGARAINQALAACLPELLERAYVIHICGQKRYEEASAAASSLSADRAARYFLVPFLFDQDMADTLAAADLVLCRSGASVLGELPVVGVPAVLVPFPDPAVHQHENATYLARHGAAIVLKECELGKQLGPTLNLLLPDRERLADMATACKALARPEAAQDIAALVMRVGNDRKSA